MAEEHITIVFKYQDGDEFRQWFKEQINSRICAVKANQNKAIQVTSWYQGDALDELDELKGEDHV